MEEILKLLDSLGLDIDVKNCKSLVDDGYLQSLDIVYLLTELSFIFDIKIPAGQIVPENFNSAEALWDMIQRLEDD